MSQNIQQYPRTAFTFTTCAMTAVTDTIPTGGKYNGWVRTVILEVPTFANSAASGNLIIKNPDGIQLFATGNIAHTTTSVITGAEVPIVGGETLEIDLSAIPSGAATAISVAAHVTLYLIP